MSTLQRSAYYQNRRDEVPNQELAKELFPYLLHHLETCRPKDVPQHAEKVAIAVGARNKKQFMAVMEKRLVDLSGPQAARVKKVIKEVEQR